MCLSEYVFNLLVIDIEDEKIDVGIMYCFEDCCWFDSYIIYVEFLLVVLLCGYWLVYKLDIFVVELVEDVFISILCLIVLVVYDLIQQYCQLYGFCLCIVLEINLQ